MNTAKIQIEENNIANMFNKIAKRYDFLNHLLSANQDRFWRKKMINMISTCPEGNFLDVATGTGDVLIELEKQNLQYKNIYAVDISKNMLEIAQKKFEGLKNNIQTKSMSAHDLRFDDNSIDTLTISFGIRNVIDKEKAIKEFSRVLKKQGSLIILEFFPPSNSALAKIFNFYFKNILPKIGALFSSKEAYSYLPKSVDNFMSYKKFFELVRSHGFCSKQEEKHLFTCCRITKWQKT